MPIIPLSKWRADLARDSLRDFIHQHWATIRPTVPLIWSWHHDVFCDVLEQVTAGKIDRLVANVPPGTSKPIHVDEPIYTDRGFIRLGNVKIGDKVLTHRGRFRPVLAVHDQGVIPTVTVSTFCGRSVRTAPGHPFLTPRGWMLAEDLTGHDYVGIPRRREDVAQELVTLEEARLLAYLVGDGSISTSSLGFTNADREVLDDFHRCAAACGFYTVEVTHPNSGVKARKIILSKEKKWSGGWNGEPPVTTWIRSHGLFKSNSYTKRIPPSILASSERVIANFIGAYWSCDGTFSVRHVNKKTTMMASATTVGKGLADDLLMALSVLNIHCRLRSHTTNLESRKQPGGRYTAYRLQATQRNEVAKFADMPGLCSRKKKLAGQAFFDRFEPDLYADAVLSVEKAEDGHCKCLTVEEDESFTVNNLAVHNSLVFSVFWPAWEWATDPSLKYLTAAYTDDNTIRDNRDLRSIVTSDQYRADHWESPSNVSRIKLGLGPSFADLDKISLASDQHAKIRFDTTAKGWRIATSVGGTGTGEHPDRIIIDDPLKALSVDSKAELDECIRWVDGTISTRQASKRIAVIVVMQRLHKRDLSGYLLGKGGWEHLMLPMRFDPARADPRDMRTIPGELLCPEQWPEWKVRRLEIELNQFGASGQLQQDPVPPGGGLFKRDWFTFVDLAPARCRRCRGWDTADTPGGGNWTVGAKLAYDDTDGATYIEHVIRGQWGPGEVNTNIKLAAELDGPACLVREGSGSGKATIEARGKMLARYDYAPSPETTATGGKLQRAGPFRAQSELGKVKIVRGPWNEAYLDVLCSFPVGTVDDDVDATSNAYNGLVGDMEAMEGLGLVFGKRARGKAGKA
jgi:predicted phage terminase large subunit-like protein